MWRDGYNTPTWRETHYRQDKIFAFSPKLGVTLTNTLNLRLITFIRSLRRRKMHKNWKPFQKIEGHPTQLLMRLQIKSRISQKKIKINISFLSKCISCSMFRSLLHERGKKDDNDMIWLLQREENEKEVFCFGCYVGLVFAWLICWCLFLSVWFYSCILLPCNPIIIIWSDYRSVLFCHSCHTQNAIIINN